MNEHVNETTNTTNNVLQANVTFCNILHFVYCDVRQESTMDTYFKLTCFSNIFDRNETKKKFSSKKTKREEEQIRLWHSLRQSLS